MAALQTQTSDKFFVLRAGRAQYATHPEESRARAPHSVGLAVVQPKSIKLRALIQCCEFE